MDIQQNPEPLSPAGYYQHLHDLFTGTSSVNLNLDEDEPYDVDTDAPWSVVQNVRLTDGR